MSALRQQLLDAELGFFTALANGDDAIQDFSEDWHKLQQEIMAGLESCALDDETIAIAHAVSSRIELYASCFEELSTDADTMQVRLYDEVEGIFTSSVMDASDENENDIATTATPTVLDIGAFFVPSSDTPSRSSSRAPSLISDHSSDSSDDDDLATISIRKRILEHESSPDQATTKRARTLSWGLDGSPEEHFSSAVAGPPTITDVCRKSVRDTRPLPTPRVSVPVTEMNNLDARKKRRLSVDNVLPSPKRPHGCRDEYQRQTVSSPFPSGADHLGETTHLINEWLVDLEDIEPATYDMPDISAAIELQVATMWHRSVVEGPVDLTVVDPHVASHCTPAEDASEYNPPRNPRSHPLGHTASGCHWPDRSEECPGSTVGRKAQSLSISSKEARPTSIESTAASPSSDESDSATQNGSPPSDVLPLHLDGDIEAVASYSCSPSPLGTPSSLFDASDAPYLDSLPYRSPHIDPYFPSSLPFWLLSLEQSGSKHSTMLDVDTLLADFTLDRNGGVSEKVLQHMQIMQEGHAIAV